MDRPAGRPTGCDRLFPGMKREHLPVSAGGERLGMVRLVARRTEGVQGDSWQDLQKNMPRQKPGKSRPSSYLREEFKHATIGGSAATSKFSLKKNGAEKRKGERPGPAKRYMLLY